MAYKPQKVQKVMVQPIVSFNIANALEQSPSVRLGASHYLI